MTLYKKYEIKYQIYADAVIQKRKDWNEHKALQEMIDCSSISKALVIADRGYESYNNMAHIQEKGWYFLIRIKDGTSSIKGNLELPSQDTFDININLKITRKQSKEVKELYASRWGIESSFRNLKHIIGMLNFHSKKVMCIQQEIYSHMIMYNFAEMITSHVVIKQRQRKHLYKANFSVAAHMCRLFYQGKTTSPNLETIISKNLSPIRPERHYERNIRTRAFRGFIYRVA